MHEICREYFECNERRFLIIVFSQDEKTLAKIFFNRQQIHQETGKSSLDNDHQKIFSSCKEWIDHQYNQ